MTTFLSLSTCMLQLANAASEAQSIREMADYVAGITVQQAGQVAQPTVLNPQIQSVFDYIKTELGQCTHANFVTLGLHCST